MNRRIPTLNIAALACAAVAAAAAFAPLQAAITVTTPANALAGDGNAANRFPFDPYDSGSMRYQQAYAASFFTTVSAAPVMITEVRFRCDAGAAAISGPFSKVISDIKIVLSTTSSSADSLSGTFALNLGSDATIVIPRGPLALSSAYINAGNVARTFDISIILQTPFLFDPTHGNLLMDVTNYSGSHLTSPNYIAFDAADSPGDGISRVFASSSGATTGTTQSLGLVTQFVTTPVPEPSLAGLLGIASLAGVLMRRR